MLYPFCFHLNELSKIRHAVSIHECTNCMESHYLAQGFDENTGAGRENIERDKFTESCSRMDVLKEIWRYLNGK